jgi:hypothetical protein
MGLVAVVVVMVWVVVWGLMGGAGVLVGPWLYLAEPWGFFSWCCPCVPSLLNGRLRCGSLLWLGCAACASFFAVPSPCVARDTVAALFFFLFFLYLPNLLGLD